MDSFTHIVIDEIHERDRHTEFLMIALRELLNRKSGLSVILMSATIQTNELMEYWSGAGSSQQFNDIVSDAKHRPAEINIPGRTFPVQTFFLEDCLAMTGFVDDSSMHFGDTMDELESSIATLLTQGGSGNGKKQKKQVQCHMMSQSTLSCIMCNKTGFTSPEELGTHVALCDGGGKLSIFAMEEKIRNTDAFLSTTNNQFDSTEDEPEEAIEDEEDIYEEDDTEQVDGLRMGKWDGESPFAVADNIAIGSKSTLTEEEMLNRYQTIHDDQQIDSDLIIKMINYICKSSYGNGAILVFLPGWQDITELMLLLESTAPFFDKSKYLVLPLHSGIPSKEQRLVFQQPRKGVRKIVLATNIAETSITIDDVAFVIDSGRAKEKVSIFIHFKPHFQTPHLINSHYVI